LNLREALEVVLHHRADRIVIATMASVGVWRELSDTGLDFHYIPSAMGHGVDLGLGIALAKPGRGVVVLCGEGSLLMNLGCLVTLANHRVPVFVIVIDNGLYEVTGGQATAGAGHTDFAVIARGAGISRVYSFESQEEWTLGAPEALTGDGPVVIWLRVEGRIGQKTPSAPRPMAEQIARLRHAINA
jgi:thiamine pyrophosphate-dependent acetolactate synthase large subunit-like protein